MYVCPAIAKFSSFSITEINCNLNSYTSIKQETHQEMR